ncbi:nitrilase-related carbon-nitrogen hydrolase [Jatrophihabitans sp. DSM 45814]
MSQLHLAVGEVAANRAAASTAIEQAALAGAELVVLPELTQSGYVFVDKAEARNLAEPVVGPTVSEWCQASARHGVIVVGGFCELGSDGELYNSAVLIEDGSVKALYRKAHLWGTENEIFRAGNEPPPVVSTAVGRVGIMVCYDLEFPEWTRMAGLAGADLLAAPVNWPLGDAPLRPSRTDRIETIKVQAAAAVNRMYVLVADRCGSERGVDWVGGTVIVDPDGYLLTDAAASGRVDLLTAEVDYASARDKRLGAHNDVFTDRRSELYELVAESAMSNEGRHRTL